MTMFYTARHAAPRAHRSAAQRTGAGVLAATALGLGASTMTATEATCSAVTSVIWKLSPDRVYWLSVSRLATTKEERMTVRTRPSKGITICTFLPPF